MTFIIKDLKDFYLFEVGKFKLSFSNFKIIELFNECFSIYESHMIAKKIEFKLEIENNIPIEWRNDPDRIQ